MPGPIVLILHFLDNIADTLALGIVYAYMMGRGRGLPRWLRDLITGVVFGLIGVTVMLNPVTLADGVHLDARSLVAAFAGALGGLPGAFVASGIIVAFRLHLEGAVMLGSPSAVPMAALLGWLAARQYGFPQRSSASFLIGLGLGVAGIVAATAVMYAPGRQGADIVRAVALPMVLIFPLGSWALGSMLAYIAQRQRNELELERQKTILQTILEHLPIGLTLTDPDLRLIALNERTLQLFNDQSRLRVLGASLDDVIHQEARRGALGPGDPQQLADAVVGRMRTLKEPWIRQMYGPGDTTLEVCNAPVSGGGLVTTITDITERKRAEAQLLEHEAILKTILDHIPVGLVLLDRDFRIVIHNQQLRSLYPDLPVPGAKGTSLGEVMQVLAEHGLLGPGDPNQLAQLTVSELRALRKPVIAEQVLPQGHVLELRHAPLPGGGLITVVSDVTARKHAEAAVAESEFRYREIFEDAAVGICESSADGVILDANTALLRTLGFGSKQELQGLRLATLGLEGGPWTELMDGHNALLRYEGQCRGKDQRQVHMRVTAKRLGSGTGSGGRLILFMEDFSAERHARRLEQANQELLELDRLRNQFLSVMAHELKTPLQGILGSTQILERMVQKDAALQALPDSLFKRQSGHFFRTIQASSQHLHGLINDVLDFSRLKAGKMDLNLEPVQLGEEIGSLLTEIEGLAAAKRLRLECAVAPDLPPVQCDRLRIRQVLLNLLSNAIKFTPEDGTITVSAGAATRSVQIHVRDSGIGIPPSDQDTIFNEFKQVGRNKREQQGTGLGLAIAKRIMELHGGKIRVSSAPDQGSTFTISIPNPAAVHPPRLSVAASLRP